jgi:predicted RNA binding protein YcfA (HicA-like mRNA interferase family)
MQGYARAVSELLKQADWEVARHRHGSHVVWKSPDRKASVVVSVNLNDRNLAQRALKQAGLSPQLIR